MVKATTKKIEETSEETDFAGVGGEAEGAAKTVVTPPFAVAESLPAKALAAQAAAAAKKEDKKEEAPSRVLNAPFGGRIIGAPTADGWIRVSLPSSKMLKLAHRGHARNLQTKQEGPYFSCEIPVSALE